MILEHESLNRRYWHTTFLYVIESKKNVLIRNKSNVHVNPTSKADIYSRPCHLKADVVQIQSLPLNSFTKVD